MLDRDDLEPVLEAAAEAWNETFDTDERAGIALVLGKLIVPDQDNDFQKWIAGMVLEGAS